MGGAGLPEEEEDVKAKLAEAVELLGTDGAIRVDAFTNLLLLHAAHEKKALQPEAEAKAAFALLGGDQPWRRLRRLWRVCARSCRLAMRPWIARPRPRPSRRCSPPLTMRRRASSTSIASPGS